MGKRSRFCYELVNIAKLDFSIFSTGSKLSDVCGELSSLPRLVCQPLLVSPLILQSSHIVVTLLRKLHSLLGHLARAMKSVLS